MIKTVPQTVSPLDVIYKWYKRLVYIYTHPDLLAKFCKVNLSNTKNLGRIYIPGLINLR